MKLSEVSRSSGVDIGDSEAREAVLFKAEVMAAPATRQRVGPFALYIALLTLAFIQPLLRLVAYAVRDELQSYILLAPFIAGYLFYVRRARSAAALQRSLAGTVIAGGIGIAALAAGINSGPTLTILAFVSFAVAGGFWFFGSKWVAARAFPFSFLIFMVPLPEAAVDYLEKAYTLASAEAAALYFQTLGIPVVRHGNLFELPGIVLQVAQECSGIRSSLILFITSLLASHLFLGAWRHRAALVAFAIPLGILRNGFRILIIGLLCSYKGPWMIDSAIHRRGGPIFFALSLVPLFLLLWWLRYRERRANLPG